MNRLTQLQKLIKLTDIEMLSLSEDLSKKRDFLSLLREEIDDVNREIEQYEVHYRKLLHGDMTLFNLERIADVKMTIEYAEKRKAGLGNQVNIAEQEVESLVGKIHRCYTINQNYEALGEKVCQEARKRDSRRLESRYDELSLVRWSRNED